MQMFDLVVFLEQFISSRERFYEEETYLWQLNQIV